MRLCDVCKESDQKKIKSNMQIKGFEKFGDMNMGVKPVLLFDDIDICDECLNQLKTKIRRFLKPVK